MIDGCCGCSGDAIQQDRDDCEVRNPRTPYADWAQLAKAEWGSDPTAVCRDYPRMRLHVSTLNGRASRVADVALSVGNPSKEALHQRALQLRECTIAIAKLVEMEGSDVPGRIHDAWATHVDGDMEQSPDVSLGLDALFKELGWYTRRSDVRLESERSPTFNILLCMAQGIAFYPSQRMSYLIWVPWAPHLRDVSWTVYVSDDDFISPDRFRVAADQAHPPGCVFNSTTETSVFSPARTGERSRLLTARHQDCNNNNTSTPGPLATDVNQSYGTAQDASTAAFPRPERTPSPSRTFGTVSVTHSFVVRNYVDAAVASAVPQCQVEWSFTITLKKGTGAWLDIVLNQPRVFVVHPRNKLQRLRTVRFNDTIFNAFGVEAEVVDALPL